LAAKLLNELKQRVKALTLVPAGGGCFEVSVDGDLIYSKLQTHVFPDEGAILDEVSRRVKKPAKR
jgi:selenoprotein W-related protein